MQVRPNGHGLEVERGSAAFAACACYTTREAPQPDPITRSGCRLYTAATSVLVVSKIRSSRFMSSQTRAQPMDRRYSRSRRNTRARGHGGIVATRNHVGRGSGRVLCCCRAIHSRLPRISDVTNQPRHRHLLICVQNCPTSGSYLHPNLTHV